MKKIIICLLISCIISIYISSAIASEEDLSTDTYNILITTDDNSLIVEESLTIQGITNETYSTITFWLQNKVDEDINILVNNNNIPYESTGNEYLCDISALNISKDTSIRVIISYKLSNNVEEFNKMVTYNTTSISVTFDEENIFSGEDLQAGGYFSLLLYKPTETPLSWYIIILIALLIILVIVLTLYSFQRQKSKIIDQGSESEELLNSKKALLMSILKDIEKQHRSKQISDDTYHKLKDQYKEQAVDAMKKLEDLKSKIK